MTQMEKNRVVAQKKMSQRRSHKEDIHTIGTVARILRNAWWEYYRNSSRENVLKLNRLLEDPYLTASIKIFLKTDLNKQTLNF
jgi:hypothetical protein